MLAGGLWVFLLRKNPGKRGVRNRRRHLGRTRKSVWGYWQSEGEGVGGRENKKPSARKPVFCESQILTSSAGGRGILIGRFTVNHRQFGVTQRRSRSVRQKNVGNLPIEKHSFGPDSATGRSLYCSRTHCWERTLAEYRKSQPSLFTVPLNKCWKNMCSQASCCFEVMQICDVKSICG